ncbi:MAG: hypothetical protein HY898_21950 [Deltaproteobacteria bacterium]|nr:hypothetical protein [Deltaproteobacteria bacterium]
MTQRAPFSNDPGVMGMLGSLALSVVRPGAPTLALRSLRWQRDLQRLGVRLAYPVVHDAGMLLAAPSDQLAIGPRASVASLSRVPGGQELTAGYEALIGELANSEAAHRARTFRLSDDMIAVVLSKILGSISDNVSAEPPYPMQMVSDASLFERADGRLAELFSSMDRTFEWQSLAAVCKARLRILTMADALDLDTLRLLGVLGAEGVAGASVQVDLLAAMASPSANDVVNFSLDILPSVLESKTRPGLTMRAGEGFGGIGTRGSVDALVLSELAWDSDDFVRRVLDNEVLYYAKESVAEPAGRRHVLVVDASASMRGDREVFARGMALATAKKLVLESEDVSIRFFDSRLYEAHRSHGGKLPTAYVLSFAGEHGRNPSRVFSELVTALDIERAHDPREIVVHVFTHAALYIPRGLVQAIKQRARIGAVFILPSGGGALDLDYLDLLDAKWIIDHDTLAKRDARARKAKDILGEIGTRN